MKRRWSRVAVFWWSVSTALLVNLYAFGKQQAGPHAPRAIEKYFFEEDFWLMITDSTGICYFASKKDARSNAVFISVPVVRENQGKPMTENTSSEFALIYRKEILLGGVFSWINIHTGKQELEFIAALPPAGWTELLQNHSAAFFIDSYSYLVSEAGEWKAWDGNSYQSITGSNTQKRSSPVHSRTMATGHPAYFEYAIQRKASPDGGTTWIFQGKTDTVTVFPPVPVENTTMKRCKLNFLGKIYKLEYDSYRTVYDENGIYVFDYVADQGLIGPKENDLPFDIIIVKGKKKNKLSQLKLVEATSRETLLTATPSDNNGNTLVKIELFSTTHRDMLRLSAILICRETFQP